MPSSINVPAIIIANIMGIVIIITSWVICKFTILKNNSKGKKALTLLCLITLLSSIIEPISFIADGQDGLIHTIILYLSNTWLFIADIVIIATWFYFVVGHMNVKISKKHMMVLLVLYSLFFLVMIVNLFTPLFFSIDEENIYHREAFYWIFMAVIFLIILDGIIMYFYAKQRSAGLKYFPVLSFTIPGVIGISIQSFYYGVSTVMPFTAVSICCVMLSLLNERTLRDNLTGLYNRMFISYLKERMNKHHKYNYNAMMLDVNDFKHINDTFGHELGDKALIDVANILTKVIKENGVVIRYAGDEFIIIVHKHKSSEMKRLVFSIHEAFSSFNKLSGKPYKLAVSIGYSEIDFNKSNIDGLIDIVDKLMYEDKKRQLNNRLERINNLSNVNVNLIKKDLDENQVIDIVDYMVNDIADIYFAINASSSEIIQLPIRIIDGVKYEMDDLLEVNKNTKVIDLIKKMSVMMPQKEKEYFRELFDCKNLVMQYYRGNHKIKHDFHTLDYANNALCDEYHLTLSTDYKGDVIVRVYTISKVYNNLENKKERMLYQKDNYCSGLNLFTSVGIYIVEKNSHKLLFYNNRFKEICPNVYEGMDCRDLKRGPCHNCPMKLLGEKAITNSTIYKKENNDFIEITTTRIMWKDKTPAIMICILPSVDRSHDKYVDYSCKYSINLDDVTGGLTRKSFIDSIENFREKGNDLSKYSIIFVNIKKFRAINDLIGIDGGDNLLRNIMKKIIESPLKPIYSSRNESDHFAFFVEKRNLNYKILNNLMFSHFKYNNKNTFVHCRCGVYNIDDPNLPIYRMMDRAKLAKESIVDEYVQSYSVFENKMEETYSDNATALLLLDSGLQNKEFVPFYQPVFDAKTCKIVSAEALVRRVLEDGTIIPPSKFVPTLEETGYITMLDESIAEQVSKFQISRYNNNSFIVPISFNMSQKDFYDHEFMERIEARLTNSNLPESSIMLEVTESTYTLNEKKNEKYLSRIREHGIKILLDDFGTGYSSFGMFENYNFDRIKLDISFVRQLQTNDNVCKVVNSIIRMCHDLNVKVVAEGVENIEQLEILRNFECDYIQGYYFSKPMNEKEFTKFLDSQENDE